MKDRIKLSTAHYRGKCGHCRLPVNPGDTIGLDRRKHRILCEKCAGLFGGDNAVAEQQAQLERMKIA